MAGGEPIPRRASDPAAYSLRVDIKGARPKARQYARGTSGFRYWAASDALARGAKFWSKHLPGEQWFTGKSLPVALDRGVDLNAYYDRRGLSFFHERVGASTVYSGESPDILLHEMGHAVLDIIRPQLWDALSVEAAAFHESFGDICAILVGLQSSELRQAVLAEVGSKLYRSSRLSRVAEELGWAIRQFEPSGAAPDALRNAVNSFFYRVPESLPPSAPDSHLSSEPHSFSRVFTAGAFEAMSNMVALLGKPTDAILAQVSDDFAHLLVEAIRDAPIAPDYFAQVAEQLIAADQDVFSGRYGSAIESAFIRRGVLSIHGVSPSASQRRAQVRGRSRRLGVSRARSIFGLTKLPMLTIPGATFGLGETNLHVHVASEAPRILKATSAAAVTAAQPDAEMAARWFTERLLCRGRVDLGGVHATHVAHPMHPHKTHSLDPDNGAVLLRRRTFDCGFD
ncbi:MAG: hypothetical protein IT454_19950 [Planctomycetes bacterium]|nr:hypothetical protein [Planctomycetota bacterium]